jgi:hypothetical protein
MVDIAGSPRRSERSVIELVVALRRVADLMVEGATGEQGIWVGQALLRYLSEASGGLTMEGALGLADEGASWWVIVALARRDEALREYVRRYPPRDAFNLALDFALRALAEAQRGVALLTRTSWLEGGERHTRLFAAHPPAIVALFAERVPMVKGRWDPKASTATSYTWVIWRRGHTGSTDLVWIPPGRRALLTKPDDAARFARHT